MKNKKNSHKRYNRRHDGVTTIQSTPERQKIEEERLRVQWNEFWKENRGIFCINYDGTETRIK